MKTLYSPASEKLSTWLREQRVARGLSMREAGKLLKKPHTFVAKTECGQRRLDVVEFIWYCERLGADPVEGLSFILKK